MGESPARAVSVKIAVTRRARAALVRLEGTIDETFDGHAFTSLPGVVVFDLFGVKRITSYGVRQWMNALRTMTATAYYFVRCRSPILSQFNMVSGFGGHGKLVSFFAPYVCEECDVEAEVPIDLRRDHALVLTGHLAAIDCKRCGNPMEFDDVPETFFAFARSAPPPTIPSFAEVLVDQLSPTGSLRVTKEVGRRVTALSLAGALDKSARFKRAVDGLEGALVVVLEGLSEVSAEGIERFRVLTRAAQGGGGAYLARVPTRVARKFIDAKLAATHLVSVLASLECEKCHTEWSIEVDATVRETMLAGAAAPLPCPSCGAVAAPPVGAVRDLELAVAPDDVIDFLSHVRASDEDGSQTPISSRVNPKTSPPTHLGRYEILRELGRGGMGVVYHARAMGAGGFERQVAIKVMHAEIASDPEFIAMFLDEARLAACIHHPNVVSTIDVANELEATYLVMDYVKGVSLLLFNNLMRSRRRAVPIDVALRIVLDMLAGLHAAHTATNSDGAALNIVHRDVSPHNVLVGFDGVTRVMDFGIASAEARLASVTKTGTVKGKVSYAAPEQLRSEGVDRRSDVYSCGIVLWELLVGRRAFTADADAQTMVNALGSVSVPPSSVKRGLPAALDDVCMKAVAAAPGDRFATAAEFAEGIERAASAADISIGTQRGVAEFMATALH